MKNDTKSPALEVLPEFFPTISDFLASLEQCPDCLSVWGRSLPDPDKYVKWWIEHGRPRLEWPKEVLDKIKTTSHD